MPRTSIDLDAFPVIATTGQWRLYHRDAKNLPWRSLVLLAPPDHRKRRYYLGWNGERIGGASDPKDLRKRHPEILTWVRDACRAFPAFNDLSGCPVVEDTNAQP